MGEGAVLDCGVYLKPLHSEDEMKRIYHHYEKWEEIQHGMWRTIRGQERQIFLFKAAELMKDTNRFYESMLSASLTWRYSCEVHLTGGFNRQAWMGHAGCCFAVGSPEDVTREAWHTLTQEEQDKANQAADAVLAEWDKRQCQNEG